MKMKKFISLLVILCVATAMLTACGKFSEERTRSVKLSQNRTYNQSRDRNHYELFT